MNNEMVYVGELPTLDIIMNEMKQYKTQTAMPETERIGGLFYLLAALQILMIIGGAILGLFLSVPVAAIFTWLILRKPKLGNTSTENPSDPNVS